MRTCDNCLPVEIHFDSARAGMEYEGVGAELVKLLKFKYRTNVLPLLVAPLLRAYDEHYSKESFNMVVPVPLHWWRRRYREFNQAELLASALSDAIDIPVCEVLKRRRRTPPQARLKQLKRLSNLKNAFAVRVPEDVCGKRILLVDDVYTTGSTVNECARVLKEAEARSIHVLTSARTV